ncbi:MAG: 4-hydroxythreonine-4-phosphate dehydrogenase PdxA [Pseudomonadota bacterium]
MTVRHPPHASMPPLALTMGDPAGIGGEIAVAAYASGAVVHPFFAIDDPARLVALAAAHPGLQVETVVDPGQAPAVWPRALPVLPQPLGRQRGPGEAPLAHATANAAATIASIERAVALARAGAAAAVVTNPINKQALYRGAGFPDPGHTEFLARLAGVPRTVMMIAGPALRVVPVTIHAPLAHVPAMLSAELIVETGRIAAEALARDFAVAAPRLAVCGLNPHAGEGGSLGREDQDIVAPAVARLQALGIAATGPHPADTLFHAAARARYDAALGMYHDQVLVPVKALDFERGVNVTLGLPFVRTSPDHGTAYDIAGTGHADATSLIEALNMAAEMAARRRAAAAA